MQTVQKQQELRKWRKERQPLSKGHKEPLTSEAWHGEAVFNPRER